MKLHDTVFISILNIRLLKSCPTNLLILNRGRRRCQRWWIYFFFYP